MDANETYGQRRKELLEKLVIIRLLMLEKLDADQARTPASWGHAGSLGHINEELDDIIEFMK